MRTTTLGHEAGNPCKKRIVAAHVFGTTRPITGAFAGIRLERVGRYKQKTAAVATKRRDRAVLLPAPERLSTPVGARAGAYTVCQRTLTDAAPDRRAPEEANEAGIRDPGDRPKALSDCELCTQRRGRGRRVPGGVSPAGTPRAGGACVQGFPRLGCNHGNSRPTKLVACRGRGVSHAPSPCHRQVGKQSEATRDACPDSDSDPGAERAVLPR